MKISTFIESRHSFILQAWDEFIKRFHAPLAADDIAVLREQARTLIFCLASSLQSESDKKSGNATSPSIEDIARFFVEKPGYIRLRLECGYALKDMVQEMNSFRSSCQDCIFQYRKASDKDTELIITLNKLIDAAMNCAMDEYSKELKISKQRFLATINHDTRSPLFAIAIGVRRFLKESQISEEIAGVAQLISKSAELAISRIGDYHDFSAIESGQKIALYPTPVDMSDLCHEIIDEIKLLFPEFSLVGNVPSNIHGTWDRGRIRQAIFIVLLNAIQSGERGNRIEVRLDAVNDVIKVDIVNIEGKINNTLKRVIYNPIMLGSVQRDHKIHFKEAESNRMGLYLAREIILSHYGALTIDQTREEGLRFGISIPRNLLDFHTPTT